MTLFASCIWGIFCGVFCASHDIPLWKGLIASVIGALLINAGFKYIGV